MPNCDSMKLQSNFVEITLRHGCFSLNLWNIFRIPFPKDTSGCLLLCFIEHLRTSISVMPDEGY